MADESKQAPIIVINKKIIAGGHHGGAWKVAFADFVTAMMALFIVLWLLNTSQNVKDAIAGYFKDPTGNGRMVGSALAGAGESLQVKKEELEDLKDKLEEAIKEVPEFKALNDQVQITVTGEGLRIELMESEKNSFFDSGSPRPSTVGQDFLIKLAKEIGGLPNYVTIEGHTDAKAFGSEKGGYSNWELSADRANAARRLMTASGLREDQVTQVRGFAAQRLRKKDDPDDPSNRRISIIVQYEAQMREEDKSLLQKGHEKEMREKGEGHGEKKAEEGHGEKKPEEHGEKKTEEHGAKKSEEHAAPEKKSEEHAPAAKKAEEHAPEKKAEEHGGSAKKAGEHKPAAKEKKKSH
jgi:chemotaxis protein MotB